jgi:hypothetical protein
MKSAIDELKASLRKLKKQLNSIQESLKEEELISEIKTIRKLIGLIDPKKEMGQKQINNVVVLSDKVIELRRNTNSRTHKVLSNLAVPPYDLWLPFKAKKGPPTKNLSKITAPVNEKVGKKK